MNVAAAVNILSSTSSSFGGSSQIDEKLQQKLLQEEEQAMSKFKVIRNSNQNSKQKKNSGKIPVKPKKNRPEQV